MNELENVKVGDFVVLRGSYAHDDCLRKVERVTKSQIIVNKRRYRKNDGRIVGGGGWSYCYIRPATENDIERINKVRHKNKLLAFIRKADLDNLSLESLQTICDVMKKEISNSSYKRE